MGLIAYIALKYLAYAAWCFVALSLLSATSRVSLSRALAFGCLRLLLGFMFGLFIYLVGSIVYSALIDAPATGLLTYLAVYVPALGRVVHPWDLDSAFSSYVCRVLDGVERPRSSLETWWSIDFLCCRHTDDYCFRRNPAGRQILVLSERPFWALPLLAQTTARGLRAFQKTLQQLRRKLSL